MLTRFCVFASLVTIGVSATSAHALSVFPTGSTYDGKTIGDYTADWNNWLGSFTAPNDPNSDATGAFADQHQNSPVFFLGGQPTGASAVTRSFTAPANKPFLIPLINILIANGVDDATYPNTRAEAEAIIAGQNPSLVLTVDGVAVPDLKSHLEESPANFTFSPVAGSPTGFPPGTYTDANADGYWVLLSLSPGEHTIHFGGTAQAFTFPTAGFGIPAFTVDVTDNINVVPLPPAAWTGAAMLAGLIGFQLYSKRRLA